MTRWLAAAFAVALAAGAAWGAPRFTVNGDGTVSDSVTGLVWQRQDDAVTRDWPGALAYCEGLILGGATDWRLPNIKELRSIADETFSSPAIDSAIFPSTAVTGYWSSTTRAGSPNFAWYVFFTKGQVSTDMKNLRNHVRCVR